MIEEIEKIRLEKAYQELCSLMRIREQKIRVNKTPVEERIKDIKRKFIRGKI